MTKKRRSPRKHDDFSADRPITSSSKDKLGRGTFAGGLPQTVFPNAIVSLANIADSFPHRTSRDFFERDGLSYAWRLIYFGLRKISQEQVHFEIIKEGIRATRGVRLSVQIVNLEERNEKRSNHDFLVKEDQLVELRSLAVERLRSAAADGRLRRVPQLETQLFWWRKWSSDAEVRAWVVSQIKSADDALWLLRTVLSTTSSSSDHKTTYTRYISLENLALYYEPEAIKTLTEPLVLEEQSKENMRALRALRWALKWKAEGRKDGYRGGDWDDGPLAENE